MRAVIFDMDGTMADVSHRVHHLDGEKNWRAFHDAMEHDPPVEAIVTLAKIVKSARINGEKLAVIIVTARHDDPRYEAMTREWIELHDIEADRIYMRADSDTRPDYIVKAEMLEKILDDGYEPFLAVDDRPEVVAMWRAHGITTLQCAPDDPGASPYAGQTLLHILVGPCGAGKSTYAEKNYKPHDIVSTDELRIQLYGDMGHSPEALARVWKLAHGLIRARVQAGCLTVLDATNLDKDDRARVLALLPRGIFARYVVIDRDLGDKIKQRGWRSEDLVIKQHRLFRKEEKNILAGDHQPYVTVQDKRN